LDLYLFAATCHTPDDVRRHITELLNSCMSNDPSGDTNADIIDVVADKQLLLDIVIRELCVHMIMSAHTHYNHTMMLTSSSPRQFNMVDNHNNRQPLKSSPSSATHTTAPTTLSAHTHTDEDEIDNEDESNERARHRQSTNVNVRPSRLGTVALPNLSVSAPLFRTDKLVH
jgi:hypothetical protein